MITAVVLVKREGIETMKKLLYKAVAHILTIAAVLICLTSCAEAQVSEEITVSLDGSLIEFDVPPQIISNRTMVPMRAFFEALGMDVEWEPDTQLVSAAFPESDIMMSFAIGDDTIQAYFGGDDYVYYSLDSPAVIVEDRTLVPVRAVSEVLGCKVVWEQSTRTVHIASMHNNNFNMYFSDTLDAMIGDCTCTVSADGRTVGITAEMNSQCDDILMQTEGGEYVYLTEIENSTIDWTDDGYYRFELEYIPFPNTNYVYFYPVSSQGITNFRQRVNFY